MEEIQQKKHSTWKWGLLAFLILLMIGVVVSFVFIFFPLNREKRAIEAHISCLVLPQQTRVAGVVTAIRFHKGMRVNRGDTLVLLQDSTYRMLVHKASSELNASMEIKRQADEAVYEQNTRYERCKYQADSVRRVLEEKEQVYYRYEDLFQTQKVSYEMYRAAQEEAQAQQEVYARYEGSRKDAELILAELLGKQKIAVSQYDACRAALELAEYNLNQCVVLATDSGLIDRVLIAEGAYVEVGKPLVGLVPDQGKWVTACFSDDLLSDVAGDAIVDVRVQLRGQCYDWQGRVVEDAPMDMPVHGQGSGTFVRTVTLPHLPDSLFARLYDGLSVDVILE